MIKGVPIQANKKMTGEWDEDLSFEVQSFTRRDIKTIAAELKAKQQTKGLRPNKAQQAVTEGESEKALLDFCLIGWKGLTYRKLAEITEGYQYQEKPEAEVEFTPENKDHLFEYMTLDFGMFLDKLITLAAKQGQETEKN